MKDSFFVGYLPTPANLSSFYRWLVPALVLLAVVAGGTIASLQQQSGTGTWNVGTPVTLTGKLTLNPYPVLHLADNPLRESSLHENSLRENPGRSVMLVVQGKRGADGYALPHANQMVAVSGFQIQRGEWRMLEIAGMQSIKQIDANDIVPPATEQLGTGSVYGEIVDSKCFLGVMKPGAGKVHRACAALCLLGGMPPIFVARDNNGNQFGYVLINADGTSASMNLAGQAAIPMKAEGSFERRGDLTYLRLPAAERGLTPLAGSERKAFGPSIAARATEAEFCGVMPQPSAES